MLSKARSAYSIFLNDGAADLVRTTLKHFNNGEPVTVLRHVITKGSHEIEGVRSKFHVDSPIEYKRFIYNGEIAEREVLDDLLKTVDKNDVVFDVGANVGTYTCYLAAVLPNDAIHAFEPFPENVRRLNENLNLNARDATIHDYALSDKSGTAELDVHSGESGSGEHALSTDTTIADSVLEIEMKNGDEVVNSGVPKPTIVKVDVEGAEMLVLKGLEETIEAKSVDHIYCEVHVDKLDDYDSSPSEIESFLHEKGYELTRLYDAGYQYFLRADLKS